MLKMQVRIQEQILTYGTQTNTLRLTQSKSLTIMKEFRKLRIDSADLISQHWISFRVFIEEHFSFIRKNELTS